MLLRRTEYDLLVKAARFGQAGNDSRRCVDSVICDRRNHGRELQRGHANFLPDGHGADRGCRPAARWRHEPLGFSGEFNAGVLSESVIADVLVKAVWAETQTHLDGGDVTGLRISLFKS